MQKWHFQSTSTKIVRIWSSWLVHRTSDPIGPAPQGVDKVYLDVPDETFMEYIPGFDVLVLSSGHWFVKKSAYVINGTVVGGQLWWPKNAGEMHVNKIEAFGTVYQFYVALFKNLQMSRKTQKKHGNATMQAYSSYLTVCLIHVMDSVVLID